MKKIIVFGVIALFVCVGFQSAFAVEPKVSNDNTQIVEDIEPKDYLFETIVAIANNPEVKELFEEYNYNIFDLDYNHKDILLKIFLKDPKLLFSELFTKPKMTNEYLDSVYNEGQEIIDIIGEDKALEMIRSVKSTDPEIVDDLRKILLNDEELSNRFTKLIELNEEFFEEPPLICVILVVLLLKCGATVVFCMSLYDILEKFPILLIIVYPPFMLNLGVFQICFFLAIVLQCIDFPYS